MLKLRFECDRCGAVNDKKVVLETHVCPTYLGIVAPTGKFINDTLPEGWSRIDYQDYCGACVTSYRHWTKNTPQHECWTDIDGKIGCRAKCVKCGEQKQVYNGEHDPYTGEHVDMVCESCAGGPYCEKCNTPVPQWAGHKVKCMYSKQDLCDTCHLQAVRNGERAN